MDAAHKPVILTYHSISSGPSPLEIPPEVFAAQAEWLATRARVAPLDEIVAALKNRAPLPERTVVLTFDDGYADFHEHAAPILLRLKLPAIVFLPTAHVGRTNSWSNACLAAKPLMGWEQIGELAGKGIDFGAHSVSHSELTALAPADLDRELDAGRRDVESHIGRTVEFFCYPYGRWNAAVRDAVKRFYRGACSTGAGVVAPDADPFVLPRVDAHYLRSAAMFRSLFTRRFEVYLGARRLIRRWRGQPEGICARI